MHSHAQPLSHGLFCVCACSNPLVVVKNAALYISAKLLPFGSNDTPKLAFTECLDHMYCHIRIDTKGHCTNYGARDSQCNLLAGGLPSVHAQAHGGHPAGG